MPAVVENMMYAGVNGQGLPRVPWHGLGKFVGAEDVDVQTALVQSGMNFTVSKRPLIFTNETPEGVELVDCQFWDGDGDPYNSIFGLVRDSDLKALNPVGRAYEVLQNHECLAFVDSLRSELGGQFRIHTAGVLHGGREVWLLAKFHGETKVGDGDYLQHYLLFRNSFGDGAVCIGYVTIRVVCANTLQIAMTQGGRGKRWVSIRHTKNMRGALSQAKAALGFANKHVEAFTELAQALNSKLYTSAQLDEFLEHVIPSVVLDDNDEPKKDEETGEELVKVRARNQQEKLKELIETGMGSQHGRGTWWGALNAVTEYVGYHRGTRGKIGAQQARWQTTFAGTGQKLNERALVYVQQIAA